MGQRPRERLEKHRGIVSAVNPANWIRHWRYPNRLLLAVPWPVFFGLVASGHLLLNLLFAGLYFLDPQGIAGVAGPTTSFAEAFFFSVHTLGSIGYGALFPASLYSNLLVTVDSLLGLFVIALVTGLVFSRFSRSTARILFSQEATVHTYNGLPTLMFRLANERRNAIIESQLRAYLAIDERSAEGQRMRRLLPLAQIRFDQRFVDMMTDEDDTPPQLEFANFNQIEPCLSVCTQGLTASAALNSGM
ncbi:MULTISPECIES: ion channel [unclassified Synechococcus]|uniref:ion channel n=1 Tax=unclassified Synechococcus TaxID=2626047 RepID=UPI0021A6CD9E|nr:MULTISPECIES: ion channel [unclassified Synechococcus]MCT0212460.1 hypothetical protein [Synechococcus sp. CS-1326]MCT0231976.1 hypothetical protein [Synechococcus sp. CS-1327]